MGLGVLLIAALAMPTAASAESISTLKARLERLKAETAQAGRAYMRAYWALDETDVKLARTNKRIRKTEKRLEAAKKRLNRRANTIYRREELDLVGFLVAAESFEEFVTRLDFMSRIGAADAETVAEVKTLRRTLLAQRKELRIERRKRARETAALRAQRSKLQARLQSKEAEFARVRQALAVSRAGGILPSGVSAMPGANGMVFPVQGSYYYSNTWGASRSGGRRRHQGTDIMARRGTPVVAVTSGTVTSKSGGLGGRTIWLRGSNGWSFYYAHLDRWIVRSGRVRAGQVIGTVGSTGNASGGAPHLHFQMHPNGGGPVNPYPYLRQME
jgi:murein DD-endopeptidase MepM/ murein hydrolase activator NlpD